MTGLSDYTLRFNDRDALGKALAALDAHEIKTEKRDGGISLRDPWGIGLNLIA
jgi:catechol 2,3-dioxygenase